MNLKATNNVETNKYELEIEVTSEEFNQAINEVYKKAVSYTHLTLPTILLV